MRQPNNAITHSVMVPYGHSHLLFCISKTQSRMPDDISSLYPPPNVPNYVNTAIQGFLSSTQLRYWTQVTLKSYFSKRVGKSFERNFSWSSMKRTMENSDYYDGFMHNNVIVWGNEYVLENLEWILLYCE